MEFRILGPLYADAGTGQGAAEIRQPLLQSALAVLLLRANMACPREWLIEALWDSEPPAAPEASLRVCISRLRRDLGDCAERLESVGPAGGRSPGHRLQRGYKMLVRPGELDLDEFNDLATQGKAELDIGNAGAAAASLAQALALWGDPPLPNLPGTPAVATAVSELYARRQAAEEDLIEARLAAGEYERVLGQLRAAILADPAHERTSEQLMRAYRGLGMRKEALEVYQRVRQAMLAELGVEPGQTLAMLHRRILADELAAEGPAPQLTSLAQPGPRLPSWQVPAPPPDFTGRADEIRQITDCLAGPGVPITVLTGPPGSGKTATAAAAALRLRSAFFDGELFAELGGVEHPRDPQQVLADLLQSLGIPAKTIPPPGPARSAMYRAMLADRKVLIVADDAASARQIVPLLPGASGAAVLVTCRGRLTGLAGARIVEIGELPGGDALALLGAAAGPDRVAADTASAASVLSACGGLPLALRIAGITIASQPGLSLAQLASKLSAGHPLDVLSADEQSVSAAISSSYYAVSGPARAAISLAAARLPGDVPGWTLAELASGHPANPAASDANVTAALTAAGLITPAPARSGSACYRMHPLVRAYAARRLPEHADAMAEALSRLRAGWLLRADRAAAQLPAVPFMAAPVPLQDLPSLHSAADAAPGTGLAGSLEWLQNEQLNLLATVSGACEGGDHELAAMLASRLIAGQSILAHYGAATRMWQSILAAAKRDGDQLAIAGASFHLALGYAESHDNLDTGIRLLKASVPVLEQSGDTARAAMGHALLARSASACGRHALAIRSARTAQTLAGRVPDGRLAAAAASAALGPALARVGLTTTAADHCLRALREARELGEPAYEAAALRALVQVLILDGRYSHAIGLCTDGVGIARGYGSEITAARFLLLAGRAWQRSGEWAAAAASLQHALAIFAKVGSTIEEITTSSLLGSCSRSAGQDDQAEAHLDRVAKILSRHVRGATVSAARIAACEAAAS
jgi:DNA-binding SARP family transcriptional activator